MNTLAWLLLALCIIGPGVGLFVTRPKPTRCECGGFKLPSAAACFDCSTQTEPEPEPKFGVGDLVQVELPETDYCYKDHHGMVGFIAYTDDKGGYGIAPRDGGMRATENELKLLRKADQTR